MTAADRSTNRRKAIQEAAQQRGPTVNPRENRMTPFQMLLHGLFHAQQHLHYLRGSGFRMAHCHFVSYKHVTGHGTWRTIGSVRCSLQQNVHIVQPGSAGK